jgi:hypothetical protein
MRALDRSRSISEIMRALVAASPIIWLWKLSWRSFTASRLSLTMMSESFARPVRATARPVSPPA